MTDAGFTPLMLALPSLTPSLAIEILPRGLTLHRLFVQTDGRTHDLVVGPEDPKGHITQKYTNTIIGRYTNRVPAGPRTLTHTTSGLTASIAPIPNSDATPGVSLHGGPSGFDQHWGFNLDASLKDDPQALNVKGHSLTMKASHTVEIDSTGLSTGKLNPVAGTYHEHSGKLIGDKFPEAGVSDDIVFVDHFYVFSPRETAPHHIAEKDLTPEYNGVETILGEHHGSPVVELASEKSGLKLSFDTNQSGVQFYSYNFSTGDGARKKIHGGSGKAGPGEGYPAGGAAFLEFHEPIASFVHPSTNPSGYDTILGPGEIYNNFVRMDVLYKSPKSL
ncbi:galactose mutarotase-like protein [Stereum hirsutum FP-91666 SS1]|uniref:galactose mutarotase-like protein n=1 Tax=Stereum hirsutum (strain FP-91666) TaxID=721885 RepID=UPI000440B0B5|nr:galactose mutarotase-like protein [Stereum hirsutum FP-91666 SS1]EIM91577.1 galactose mutarotase-like protein [Stereum hirsutum FP-91666 SS1]